MGTEGFGQGAAFFRLGNHLGEVVVGDSWCARHGRDSCGEQSVCVAFLGKDDAVGRDQGWSGEFGELSALLLPCTPVMARQIWMFAELGIHVGRQHFTVGIDFDVGAFALFEQVVQIDHVVAGDEDAWAGLGALLNRCRRRSTEPLHMPFIEHLHDA